jgi:L-serine dehydratase
VALSILDLFTIGVGPSSSHTVGPMRAARHVATRWAAGGALRTASDVVVELYGSLGATGRGHGTEGAVVAGLAGETPEHVDPEAIGRLAEEARRTGTVTLVGGRTLALELRFSGEQRLPRHPNGICFRLRAGDAVVDEVVCYSVGGGAVVDEDGRPLHQRRHGPLPFPYRSGDELLEHCARSGQGVSEVALANEGAFRPEAETRARLSAVAAAMRASIERGLTTHGVLPGSLGVRRRAARLYEQLTSDGPAGDGLGELDWLSTFAIAVNEENAAGGQDPGGAVRGRRDHPPAVLEHYRRFVPGADERGVHRFLLAAGAVGIVYKETASVSGAEVGCQGEVGSACSMAAAGLVEALGGTPRQVENAAEIGMEHNLGLTCDPVGGLVQVPCIERNALAAVKAITAARIARRGDGAHLVSLDQVIRTMRETGAAMGVEYKETSLAGLAVNVVEC